MRAILVTRCRMAKADRNGPQKPQHIRPLSCQKRTHAKLAHASAYDPKRTLSPQAKMLHPAVLCDLSQDRDAPDLRTYVSAYGAAAGAALEKAMCK